MSVAARLRQPLRWLLAAACGVLGCALLLGPLGSAAVLAGAGIAGVVLAASLVPGAARDRRDTARAIQPPRDQLPAAPAGSAQAQLHARAVAAVLRLGDLAGRPADPWVAAELHGVLARAAPIADSMGEVAGRVTLLDASLAAARPDALAGEIDALQQRMRSTRDAQVRREQARALAALDAQADAVDRLLARRDALLAQLQAAAAGLENLAARAGELVAMGAPGADDRQADALVADLTTSLDGVREGLDEARRVLRELDGGLGS